VASVTKKQFAPENNTAVFMDLKREKKKGNFLKKRRNLIPD